MGKCLILGKLSQFRDKKRTQTELRHSSQVRIYQHRRLGLARTTCVRCKTEVLKLGLQQPYTLGRHQRGTGTSACDSYPVWHKLSVKELFFSLLITQEALTTMLPKRTMYLRLSSMNLGPNMP